MKKTILVLSLAAVAALGVAGCKNDSTIQRGAKKCNVTLRNEADTLNWVMGESLALSVMQSGYEVDKEMIVKAFKATLDECEQPLSGEAYSEALMKLNDALAMKSQAMVTDARQKEQLYFDQLLKENPNIRKSDFGFYYEVVKEGKGRRPRANDIVVFDFRASFTNGQLFDQTYGNRDAITHVVGNPMFQGMQDAFTLMPEGSTFKFYFPFDLAFGAQGSSDVPPCTTIIYEVELHKVK